MTSKEISNNYEFKLVRRMLMREYPWILNVKPSGDEDEQYTRVSFMDVLIDPYKLAEERGWEIASYVPSFVRLSGTFMSPYLGTFFVSGNDAGILESEIEKKISEIHSSPAIPPEHRFKKKLIPSEWRYTPTPTQPPD